MQVERFVLLIQAVVGRMKFFTALVDGEMIHVLFMNIFSNRQTDIYHQNQHK